MDTSSRTIPFTILIAGFIILISLLSGIGVLEFSVTEILCLTLIVAGIGLAYIGLSAKSDSIVFAGTILFLIGTFLLTYLNFEVVISGAAYIPVVFFICAAGFLMTYINKPSKKINILISILLFVSAFILVLTQTTFEFRELVPAILPMLYIYWPVIVIFLLLVFFLGKEK